VTNEGCEAVNTVIQYQNCNIIEFMLKCVRDLASWLLGVGEILGICQ
jgi:hypothetical protein